MENVVLAIHLILALLLTGAVLMQRSEGGGLGMGGGGGGAMTARGAANALTRATWILAGAFIVTSIILTILAAAESAGSSVTDQIGVDLPAPAATAPAALEGDLLPPTTDAPAAPPAADLPAAPPAAEAPAAPPATEAPAAPPASEAPAAPPAPAPAPAPATP